MLCFIGIVKTVCQRHKTVCQMDVFNNDRAVPVNSKIIVAEIPEAFYTKFDELRSNFLCSLFRNAEYGTYRIIGFTECFYRVNS